MKFPFVLTLFLFSFIIRGLIVILHEFGHAVPAALLTKKKVSVYIGSYGDPDKSLNWQIGLFDIWLSYESLALRNGLCVYSGEGISINKKLICTLSGPLSSLFFSIILSYCAFAFEMNDTFVLFALVFLGLAIVDVFINLIPSSDPIELYNGEKTYNDGQNIATLLKYRSFPKTYEKAVNFFNNKNYLQSVQLLDAFLDLKIEHENIYRLNISANIKLKNYEKAKKTADVFLEKYESNSDDFCNIGLIYSALDFQEDALSFYEKSLLLNPDNEFTLNNKGYTFNLLTKFSEAIPLFDKAIEINQSFAYAYSNRGLSKIKIGKADEGLRDIEKSMKLDKNNSYAYRNLGIYHFERGEFDQALVLFIKARELDSGTHMINELIAEVNCIRV